MRTVTQNPIAKGLIAAMIFVLTVNASQPTTCPLDCICTPIGTPNPVNYLHAKCSSLDGIAVSPKTSTIQSVDCSGTGIEKITNQLDKLSSLLHLDASQNNLTEVPRLRRRIQTLNLSHNRITSGKLNRIPSAVHHLNLSYNQITHLPISIMALGHLKSIELAGNDIDCTCDTLQVRNWLQSQHIRTDNYVVCASPLSVKGMPWLQVRKSELCGNGEDIWNDEDENEIMLNDQAVVDDRSSERVKEEDELERDFLPLEKNVFKRQLSNDSGNKEEEVEEGSGSAAAVVDEDGSGESESPAIARMLSVETTTEGEEEGSGSDVAVLVLISTTEDSLVSSTTEPYDEDVNVQLPTLGIFQNVHVHTFDETSPIPSTTEADDVVGGEEDAKSRVADIQQSEPVKNDPLATEEKSESAESTYVLLIILGILLVGLIVFVVIKRKTARQRSANNADAENANSKELALMNREQLGKPVNGSNANNNGGANEILPLIGHRDKWDSRIQPHHGLSKTDQEELHLIQEPLLKKIDEPTEYAPVVEKPEPVPRTQRPVSSGSNHPQSESNNNYTKPETDQPDIVINEPVVPISPKPARYSPVYSPETGRVKIKLTETQKPRTPMLVSRTRSNAGEMITTPLRQPK